MAAIDPRAEDTRQRLIAAGLELFGRRGFDGVTTRQLAEAAQVNQAAIPYHFGGKEGVYLAVAGHIAADTAARFEPVFARLRQALAAGPTRDEAAELLLELTLDIARVIYVPGLRTAWFSFVSREQLHPTAAFDRLYAAFSGPLHELASELVARLGGGGADSAETILLTQAYLGQLVGFASGRATLNRRLGREGDYGPEEVEAVIAAIGRFSRIAIAGLGNSPKLF